jgi:hypothetical protein
MSFINYPAALPYFAELHEEQLLNDLIAQLSDIDIKVTTAVDKLQVSLKDNPFMAAFDEMANQRLTDNGALTNASTRDAVFDLFYGIEAVSVQGRNEMFQAAWDVDPLTTLHIIFYARSIHRGKSAKESFLNAFCWLLQHHPRTALANLHVLIDGTVRTDAQLQSNRRKENQKKQAEGEGWDVMDVDQKEEEPLLERRDFKTHGYWKDLCTILTIYCQGEVASPSSKNEFKYLALEWPRTPRDAKVRRKSRRAGNVRYSARKKMTPEEKAKDLERMEQHCAEHNKTQKMIAQEKRHEVRVKRFGTVSNLLNKDKTYRALHFTIARLFADQLKTDMTQLEKNKTDTSLTGRHALGFNLSLAAKWAPSLCNSHDKHTLLATSIAELLFPPQEYQEKDELRNHYVNKVRELYRKQYLVPLRAAMDITEHYKQEGKWELVDIRHIPSLCLDQNLGLFFKHAPDTVIAYMDKVANDTKKVSGATLGPHDLVHRVRTGGMPAKLKETLSKTPGLLEKFIETQKQLVNGQWDTLLGSIRDTSLLASGGLEKNGKKKKRIDLGECIAICDVSGSMTDGYNPGEPEKQPLNAAIGLSLIVSNLAKPPFNGAVITFTNRPALFKVSTDQTFTEQVNTILDSPVGYNTDLCRVFTDVLLPMAKKHNLKQEDMVKRLFIFSDMEFDSCDNGMSSYLTTHEFIRKQYQDAGCEVPELVWWNLCSNEAYLTGKSMNAPVTKDDVGVSLLHGFSSAMIKTFLDGDVGEDDDQEDDDQEEGDDKKERERQQEIPMAFLKKAVYHESFNGLVVVD